MNKQITPALRQVAVKDGFFSKLLDTIETKMIPDVLRKFEHDRGGAIDNFDRVRDGVTGEHAGPPWYDGLTYETMTGISDLMTHYENKSLDMHMDSYVARIGAAAILDKYGYINTFTQTMEPTHRFGYNGGCMRDLHEIYNAGALVEAGVHHYLSTGKTALLDTAVRFARYLCSYIGEPPKKNIVPAHSLPEEAFVELYRLFQTDEKVRERYPEAGDGKMFLELVEFWIENRGHHCGKPDWKNVSHEEAMKFVRDCGYGDDRPSWGAYAQDHMPVLSQPTIEGHAVRAALLFTGLAACTYENERTDYFEAAKRIWENMVYKRMHASGGIGAIREDEKFGPDFYLPHEAYLETCAVIGAIFFSFNMYLLTGEERYMRALENSLINGALTGVSLSGTKYSYVNPLISDGSVHRWEWHECPCCPPMDLKLYGKLPRMIYSYTEDTVTVNLLIGSKLSVPMGEKTLNMTLKSNYPWHGDAKLIFENGSDCEMTLRVRVPDWSRDAKFALNGCSDGIEVKDGYAVLRGKFEKGDVLDINCDMPVQLGFANPKAEDCRGQVLLRRGPVLYCLEGTDNPNGVDILLKRNTVITPVWEQDLLGGVMTLTGVDAEGNPFRAVPFFRWDNREGGTMRMWLRSEEEPDQNWTWDDALYQFRNN